MRTVETNDPKGFRTQWEILANEEAGTSSK